MNVSHHGCKALRNMLPMMFISSCDDNSPIPSLPTAPPHKHLEPHIDNRFWCLFLRLLSRGNGFSHRAPKHKVWPQTRIGPLSRFCSYENPRCQWAPTHGGSKYYSPPTRTGPGQLRIPRFSHRGALKLKLYKVSHSDPSLIFSKSIFLCTFTILLKSKSGTTLSHRERRFLSHVCLNYLAQAQVNLSISANYLKLGQNFSKNTNSRAW